MAINTEQAIMFHFCFVPKVDGSIVQWSLIVAAGWPFYQKQAYGQALRHALSGIFSLLLYYCYFRRKYLLLLLITVPTRIRAVSHHK